jgi:hypothetical protein
MLGVGRPVSTSEPRAVELADNAKLLKKKLCDIHTQDSAQRLYKTASMTIPNIYFTVERPVNYRFAVQEGDQ